MTKITDSDIDFLKDSKIFYAGDGCLCHENDIENEIMDVIAECGGETEDIDILAIVRESGSLYQKRAYTPYAYTYPVYYRDLLDLTLPDNISTSYEQNYLPRLKNILARANTDTDKELHFDNEIVVL